MTLWLDGDNDGNQDSGEPGIADVTVWLCSGTPCNINTAIMTTTTDYEGYYNFINIGAGT
ncbi:MAG: SdrD B-like domain-containing protein [Chloroflexota bacterium]